MYTGRFSGIFVKTVHKKLSCRGPRRGSFRDALLEWAFSRCDGPQIRGANLLLGWVVWVGGLNGGLDANEHAEMVHTHSEEVDEGSWW